MTVKLGDVAKKPARHIQKEQRVCRMSILCNGSGGVTSVTADDPVCAAVDGGANGDLDITFPAFPSGQVFGQVYSPANTVGYFHLSALDITAGTATIITGKNTTNTDPANLDRIYIQIYGTVAP